MTVLGLNEPEDLERRETQMSDRRANSAWHAIIDNKIVAALVVAFVLWTVAKVSGFTVLPDMVAQHETRITRTEVETRELREARIKSDAQFSYIKEQLDRVLEQGGRRQR